jgi:hypothetical protein
MKNRKLHNPLLVVFDVYVKTASYINTKELFLLLVHFCFQV